MAQELVLMVEKNLWLTVVYYGKLQTIKWTQFVNLLLINSDSVEGQTCAHLLLI